MTQEVTFPTQNLRENVLAKIQKWSQMGQNFHTVVIRSEKIHF